MSTNNQPQIWRCMNWHLMNLGFETLICDSICCRSFGMETETFEHEEGRFLSLTVSSVNATQWIWPFHFLFLLFLLLLLLLFLLLLLQSIVINCSALWFHRPAENENWEEIERWKWQGICDLEDHSFLLPWLMLKYVEKWRKMTKRQNHSVLKELYRIARL